MIFDKIENANLYKGLNPRITKALKYIQSTNFSNLTPGKYEIDGENIFAIISEYFTKNEDNQFLEAHCKYLDIQYMAEGNEYIGVTTHINQQPTKQYNKKDDFSLYKEPYSLQLLQQGMFAVFYPDDLHLPGINYHKVAKVKKVVVKVKL